MNNRLKEDLLEYGIIAALFVLVPALFVTLMAGLVVIITSFF